MSGLSRSRGSPRWAKMAPIAARVRKPALLPKKDRPMAEHIGVYPGTFDPITNGHLDIIRRAARLVDRLVIAVAKNAGKGPLFTLDERLRIIEAEIAGLPSQSGYRI